MIGFLLDTNVLSEFNRRGAPNALVKHWLESADSTSLYVSVLTVAEIRFGVELLPESKRRVQLQEWLDRDFPTWFEGRLLPVDKAIAERWGVLRARAQVRGRPLSVVDGLLAATAAHHNLTIVSRNISHFSGLGTALINPWESAG